MPKHKISTYIIASIIALGFYLFSSVVPYYSDDWWHSFIHQADGSYPTERIESFDDIITSQINHYMNKNGRLPVTMLAQTIVSFCPKPIFDLLNTLFYALTLYLLSRYCFGTRITASQLITSAIAVFYILPGHYDTLMWASGAIYYLWVTAYILFILLLWRRLSSRPIAGCYYPIILILGILAGWSNEALSFGLAAGVVIELVCNYKKRNNPAQYWLAAGIILGAIMIVAAPGSWKRTGWVSHSFDRPDYYISLLYALLIPCLLYIAIILLHRHNKKQAQEFLYCHRISIIATTALIPVCIVTWQFAARSCYGMALFALIPLLSLWSDYVLPLIDKRKILRYSLVCFIVIGTSLILYEHTRVEKTHRALIEQYINSKDGVVALDAPDRAWYAQPFTLDLEAEYLTGWTSQHMVAYYGGEQLQWMSSSLYDALSHPQLLFNENNRVAGNNNLYTTPHLDVYVVKPNTEQPDLLCYTYSEVSFHDNVPLHAKILRAIYPARYPTQEVLPAYYTSYSLQEYGTYLCIEKNKHRNVVTIDQL